MTDASDDQDIKLDVDAVQDVLDDWIGCPTGRVACFAYSLGINGNPEIDFFDDGEEFYFGIDPHVVAHEMARWFQFTYSGLDWLNSCRYGGNEALVVAETLADATAALVAQWGIGTPLAPDGTG